MNFTMKLRVECPKSKRNVTCQNAQNNKFKPACFCYILQNFNEKFIQVTNLILSKAEAVEVPEKCLEGGGGTDIKF